MDKWILPEDIIKTSDSYIIRYDSPPSWEGGKNCTGSFTTGAKKLAAYLKKTFPGIRSVQGYACRQNTANPKETSTHGTGRALDIMIPMIGKEANSAIGDPIANWLVSNAQNIGIQYMIWNRTSWNGSKRANKLKPYTGPVPHTDHIHMELNKDGADGITPWFKTT